MFVQAYQIPVKTVYSNIFTPSLKIEVALYTVHVRENTYCIGKSALLCVIKSEKLDMCHVKNV